MKVFRVTVATGFVEFHETTFFEFIANLWMIFSAIFTKPTFVVCKELAHVGGVKLRDFHFIFIPLWLNIGRGTIDLSST